MLSPNKRGIGMSDDESKKATSLSARLGRALELIVKIAAIVVPVLYVLGRLYSDAYWEALSLPPSLVQRGFEDYLYLGFLSLLLALARTVGASPYGAMAYAALFALAVALFVVVALFVSQWLGPKIRAEGAIFDQWLQDLKASPRGEVFRHLHRGAAIWSGLTSLMLIVLAAVLMLFLPVLFAINSGKVEAQREYTRQRQPVAKGRLPMLAHYAQGDAQLIAPLVECSDTWCVVYREGAFIAVRRDAVDWVDHRGAAAAGH
jgi:hypothetical protein